MQGRVHLYEGYSAQQVAFPIRVFARMGVKAVVLTNAAGGINSSYGRGALVVIRDHINLQGQNPLLGPNDDRFGPRFPDMTDAYNAEFRKYVLDEAPRVGGDIYEGVYAAVLGPSYETPAEIRYLQDHWRRSCGNVHRAGSDRGSPPGNRGAGDLLCHQHGRRNERREDQPRRSARDR